MKKLFKFIIYSLVVLAAAEVGVTYYFSMQVEQKFRTIQKVLSENPVFSVEVIDYKNMVFISEATTVITFKQPQLEKPIQIKHKIFNGPITFNINNEKPVDFQLAIIQSTPEGDLGTHLPFIATTVVDYQDNVESSIAGSAYSFGEQGIKLSGSKWMASYEIAKSANSFKWDVVFPEATVEYMGMPASIKDVEMHFDHAYQDGNWLGSSSFLLKNVMGPNQMFEVDDFKFEEKSSAKDNLIDTAWLIELAKASFLADIYGPISIAIKVENIDSKALKILTKNVASQNMDEVQAALEKLLMHKPRILIENASLALPQGNIQLNAEFSVGGVRAIGHISPEMLANSLEGSLNMVATKSLVEQGLSMILKPQLEANPDYQKMDPTQQKQALEQQIQLKLSKLKQNGTLVEKGNEYEVNIKMKDGQWVLPQGISQPVIPAATPAVPASQPMPANPVVPTNPAAPANQPVPASQPMPVGPLAPISQPIPANQPMSVSPSAPMNQPTPASQSAPVEIIVPMSQPAPMNPQAPVNQ